MANPGYDSIMGPAGAKKRRQLQIGDRLADGSIWTGDTKLQGLRIQQARLTQQIKETQAQLAKVEAEIEALEAELDAAAKKSEPPPAEEAPEPEPDKSKRRSSSRKKAEPEE